MGMIPKQTKASIKIIGSLGLYKIVGAFAVIVFGDTISKALIPSSGLRLLFVAFLTVVYFILTSKGKNPNKYFITELQDYFKFLFSPKTFVRSATDEAAEEKEVNGNNECEKQLEEIITSAENTEDTFD